MNVKAKDGVTPLHICCLRGDAPTAQTLLDSGADSSARDAAGNSPMHAAAEGAHTDIVAMLKAAGARVDVSNAEGSLPVHVAPIGHFVRTLLAPSEAEGAAAAAADGGGAEKDGLEYFNRYAQETPLTPRDFELIKVLGQGAFAKVYLVRGKGSNKSRFFAMKA